MRNNNHVVYENVVVIAVHMPGAEEMLFEDNHELIMEQYRKFLNDCAKVMQGNYCMDIVLYNNQIYGIYDGSHNKTGWNLETTGIMISRLVRTFNFDVGAYYAERLLCGIGIATGTATKINIYNPRTARSLLHLPQQLKMYIHT